MAEQRGRRPRLGHAQHRHSRPAEGWKRSGESPGTALSARTLTSPPLICSRERGIRLKINTVVTRSNCDEDLTGFIARARPERWKLLQVLPVVGQNDGAVDDQVITPEQFAGYVTRNQRVVEMGVAVIPESNELMTGSYVMVDPAGRFFDNTAGAHVYSRPINQVGVDAALREVSIDPARFRLRDGLYDW